MNVLSTKFLGVIHICEVCPAIFSYKANEVAADGTVVCPVCGFKQESKMTAKLIRKGDRYVCGNCLMPQDLSDIKCRFCGFVFSNWEEVVLLNYNDIFVGRLIDDKVE